MPRPCNCPAYPFPHRWGGGKCSGNRYVCTSCAQECYVKREDFGIGPYEYAGAPGVHHCYADVSDCCEADVYDYWEDNLPLSMRLR
jgi:hypothetical protein